jgi:hypothetical protein
LTREPSVLAYSLRAVALVITLVSVVTLFTVGYTAYVDASNVLNTVSGGSQTSAIAAKTVVQGLTAIVYMNVTLANSGLYPVVLSLVCLPSSGSGIICTSPSITVLPGQSQTLHFMMTVENYSQTLARGLHVDGQVKVAMEPFVSINLAVDLGTLIAGGGA